jgi:hypothetical protein
LLFHLWILIIHLIKNIFTHLQLMSERPLLFQKNPLKMHFVTFGLILVLLPLRTFTCAMQLNILKCGTTNFLPMSFSFCVMSWIITSGCFVHDVHNKHSCFHPKVIWHFCFIQHGKHFFLQHHSIVGNNYMNKFPLTIIFLKIVVELNWEVFSPSIKP